MFGFTFRPQETIYGCELSTSVYKKKSVPNV